MSPALLFCILIGYFARLSGATFISVPGAVGTDGFGYAQIIIGCVIGYVAVAVLLLPLYLYAPVAGVTATGDKIFPAVVMGHLPGFVQIIFLAMALVFKWVDNPSMIVVILKLAGYTYGPLPGLFAFGMMTTRTLNDRLVPVVTVGAPILCALLEYHQRVLLGSYRLGPRTADRERRSRVRRPVRDLAPCHGQPGDRRRMT